jgi:hypothetical protein
MPTKAIRSKGVELQRSSGGSPDVFVKIAEVTNFDGPNKSLPTDDATSFDSVWDEVIPGIPSGGEITFQMNLVSPANEAQAGLEDDLENGTLRAFRLVLPDAASSKREFSGYVTAFKVSSGGPNAKIAASCTIRVSGGVS